MKSIKYFVSLATLAILFSCNQPKDTEKSAETETSDVRTSTEATTPSINIDSLTADIDTKRSQLETEIGEPVVLSTSELRERVKQKWEKIHFYTLNNEVVRIKTYPHSASSARTEEFYLQNGNLILVAIEDNGAGERNKAKEQMDKLYYFNNGEIIKELKSEKEAEYSIRDGDAEELLSEVKEYLELFAEMEKS